MDNLQSVVEKVLSDEIFCVELLLNPKKILKENGVEPTKEMIETLETLDIKDIQKLAKAYGQGERGAFG